MKLVVVTAILALLVASALAQDSVNTTATASANAPSYSAVGEALQAASNVSSLSTLVSALQAANLNIPSNATWTIFAPTNDAFADAAIQTKTGLTAAQLLEPANQAALISVLSYHVVPAAAVTSTQLTNGQSLATLLTNNTLTVSLAGGKVVIQTPSGVNATVVAADVKAGSSVIHVIDRVLLPAGLVKA